MRKMFALAVVLLMAGAGAAQQLQVRIDERLESGKSPVGSTFQGSLAQPVTISGYSCPRGSQVHGRVTESTSSGRLKTPGVLELQATSIQCSGRRLQLDAAPVRLEGRSHTKRNTALIGGGAAAGAIIGGLSGGTKGAIIGGAVGAGAGTATAAATGKQEAVIEPEAIVAWNLNSAALAGQNSARGARQSRLENRDSSGNDYSSNRNNDDFDRGALGGFSSRDRRVIRGCINSGKSGLPPGLAKRDRLPPGLERQVQRNGTLPPGLQKKVQPLPGVCSVELPRIPRDWQRVILGQRVLLLNPQRRIIDLFLLPAAD